MEVMRYMLFKHRQKSEAPTRQDELYNFIASKHSSSSRGLPGVIVLKAQALFPTTFGMEMKRIPLQQIANAKGKSKGVPAPGLGWSQPTCGHTLIATLDEMQRALHSHMALLAGDATTAVFVLRNLLPKGLRAAAVPDRFRATRGLAVVVIGLLHLNGDAMKESAHPDWSTLSRLCSASHATYDCSIRCLWCPCKTS